MKICNLIGGLGNQMFEYAVLRALEKDPEKNVFLDLKYLNTHAISTDKYVARGYELSIFKNLRAEIFTESLSKKVFSRAFIRRNLRKLKGFKITMFQQPENQFVKIPEVENIYMEGYFQSEKYFKHIRPALLNDFIFPCLDNKNEALKQQMLQENSVSIHVRRGDYLSLPCALEYHGILSIDYYTRAIQLLNNTVSDQLTYYIFSDDTDAAKEYFAFLPNYHIVNGNKGTASWKDIALMNVCKHHITANSSFSWWGAWLAQREGVNISPANWFSSHVPFNIHDFVPDSWHII